MEILNAKKNQKGVLIMEKLDRRAIAQSVETLEEMLNELNEYKFNVLNCEISIQDLEKTLYVLRKLDKTKIYAEGWWDE